MVIIEIQKGDTLAVLHEENESTNIAEQIYHTKLSYAAVSTVPVHSVILLTDDGRVVKSESYYHEA